MKHCVQTQGPPRERKKEEKKGTGPPDEKRLYAWKKVHT
jgi:hypothetical protein